MSYLYSDFSSEDRVSLLELEINRLQDLCRKNFAMMDEMRKESKKLQEVHTELKETTSDLAYSLASVQCPWWQSESLQDTTKILASFAQKIQYILELPTFIDPIEQLEKNGRLHTQGASNNKKILKSNRHIKSIIRTCQKCGKKFRKIASYEVHSRLPGHGCGRMKLKCRFCFEAFQSFIGLKIHLKNFHSFPENSVEDDDNRKEQLTLAERFKRNHVRVWRFIKCSVCDTVCSSIASLKNHQKYCRAVPQKQEKESPNRTAINPASIIVKSSEPHRQSIEKNDQKRPKNQSQCQQSTAQLIDLSRRPHLLVTLHEDTSEEVDKSDLLAESRHGTSSQSQNVSSARTLCVPTSTSGQTQNQCSSSVPSGNAVTSSNENNEIVATDPDPGVDIEPMTVAEAPVRLSSMHAFSINTTTVTSSSSNIPAGCSMDLQMANEDFLKRNSHESNSADLTTTATVLTNKIVVPSKNGVVSCQSGLEEVCSSAKPVEQQSTNSTVMSTHDVSNNKISTTTTTTMCFLPSSSSSWEESDKDHDLPSPSSQGTQCQASEGLLVNNKYTCSHRNCTRSFITRGKLFHHEKTHTEIGESRSFSCQLCSKVFKDKYRLKTHFFTHCSDNSQKLMYRCIECGVFHDSLKDLARHTEVDHSESKLKGARYQCQSCAFCTNFRCKLDLHRKSSHQCRVSSNSTRSKGSSGRGDASSRVGGYTVFRDSSVL